MSLFPIPNVLQTNRVIRVFGSLFVNIEDYKRQEHFFWVDLIDRPLSLGEMGRRVAMGAPLSDQRIPLGEEPFAHRPLALVVAIDRLSLLVGKTRPVWNARLEGVSQIDELLGLDGFNELGQPWFLGLLATACQGYQQAE
jgi:hypothetical protein